MKAILYARVSRDDGVQDPQVQLHALREWAASRGWKIVGEQFDRITGDPGRRKGDPPGLRAALQLVQDRKADVLAVFAADRLVRSPVALLQLVARVQQLGGHVASLQDGSDLDTTTDLGELYLFLRGWMARMEMRLLRARTKAGLARARAEGKRLGRPPLADARTVAQLRANGRTWPEIATQLGCTIAAARGAADRYARAVDNGGSGSGSLSVENGADATPILLGDGTGRFSQGCG